MNRVSKKTVLAWHFLQADKHLRYGDKKLVETGSVFKVDSKKLVLCSYGLHASKRAIDALKYSPGPIICRVRLSGTILSESDKLCASEREVLWMADATNELHEFACWSAEQSLYLFEKEYPKEKAPRMAIEAKRRWIKGEISDRDLDAARSAAWSAAESAAWSAARSAARSAAWSAAESAAESAAWSAQNKQLTAILKGLKP